MDRLTADDRIMLLVDEMWRQENYTAARATHIGWIDYGQRPRLQPATLPAKHRG